MKKKQLKVHTVNKNYVPKGFTLLERIDDYNIILDYTSHEDVNNLMDYENIVEVEIMELK